MAVEEKISSVDTLKIQLQKELEDLNKNHDDLPEYYKKLDEKINQTISKIKEYKFSNNFHGQGKMEYKNGEVFEGEWQFGKRQGLGKTTKNGVTVFEGRWESDKLVS